LPPVPGSCPAGRHPIRLEKEQPLTASPVAQKLARGATLRFSSLAFAFAVSFFTTPFFVHTLGDRYYGIWTLVATFIGYYDLLDLGLSIAVTRFAARALGEADHDTCNRISNTSLLVFGCLGALVLLIGAVLAACSPAFTRTTADGRIFWQVILISSAAVAVTFPVRTLTGLLQANLSFAALAALEMIFLALRTTLFVAVLKAGGKVVAMTWVTLIAGLLVLVVYLYCTRRQLPFLRFGSRYLSSSTARTLFAYSFFVFVVQLADLFRFQSDAFVIAPTLGLAAVTHYRIAAVMAINVIPFLNSIVGVLMPVFSRQEAAGDFRAVHRTFLLATKISICVSSFVGFGLIAWARPFITRWVGPQYLDAAPCLIVLVAAYLTLLWQVPSHSLLFGISRHKVLAAMNFLEGVANLALSLVLVRKYGLIGVAVGTLIPMVIVKGFVQPVYTCRVSGIPLPLYLREVGRTAALVAASLLLPCVVGSYLARPSYPALALAGCVSALLYAVPVVFTAFTPDERRMLTRALWPKS
jgi:O-antigen/teichoic acid export membrane protein